MFHWYIMGIWYIRYIAILMFLVTLSNATQHYHTIKIKTGEEHKLKPKIEDGPAESKWDLETCNGCKIVITCNILSPTCDDHLLTIFDGRSEHHHCGPENWSVMHTSYYNKMTASIKTTGLRSGSYCRVKATKPYTNNEYIEINSSEHGNGKSATRSTSCKCGWRNKSIGRIVGGGLTSVNEFPFVVLIMLKSSNYAYCGGSIITPYHILTAAHCTFAYQKVQLAVIVGEHDREQSTESPYTKIIDVERTMIHPDYNHGTSIYDISIMKLREPIEFSDGVGPVCLPDYRHKNLVDEYVKVMGWGRLKTNGSTSHALRHVNLKVIDLDICKTVYTSVNRNDPYQICTWAPKRDSCQGDSGGPLVWRNPETNRYVQIGVVSFGRECGQTDPAVNTDVAYFMNWIKEKINETSPQDVCI